MATEIVIPKLGMTMVEAKVAQWKAKEAEWIEEGQQVLVIETEKVSYEVEALGAGFLHIMAGPGTVLRVGGVAGKLARSREELAQMQGAQPALVAGEAERAAAPVARGEAREGRRGRIEASPLARKMAETHGIDITAIEGTGLGGKIKREDVERVLAQGDAQAPTAAPVSEPRVAASSLGGEVIEGKRVKATIPLSGMRKAIADHMERSLRVSAQLTVMAEIDAGDLVRIRKSLAIRRKQLGARISHTDILVFVLARALREFPIVNSSLMDDRLVLWDEINIGVATAIQSDGTQSGLLVPVVKNADQKSLVEISRALQGLTERAQAMKPLPEDLAGGTFTLSNVSMFASGWYVATPIIHQPEAAILMTSNIVERPVVKDGQIVIRPIMPVSLTFDHRILDGELVGRFLDRLRELLENLHLMFV